jgi:hypothetical protein
MSHENVKICTTCGVEKLIEFFPKWRTTCKACKSAENSARLKERYANDEKFAELTKHRSARWQQVNAERSNEYHRRRHARKMAEGDKSYASKMDAAQRRYRNSEKGKAAITARMKRYEETGQMKAWQQARKLKPESRTSALLASIRNRALKLNIEFTLVFDDVYPAIVAGRCQATDLPFDLTQSNVRVNPWAPSVDRRDGSKGYTKDNIQIVCWAYNAAKNGWGDDVLLKLARAIIARHPD